MLAVSPLAATRSAPTMTASTSPRASRDAAAPSVSTVTGIPACWSSQAVSRAPCSSGRVSHASTSTVLAGRRLGVDDAERRAPAAAGHEPAGVADRQQTPRVGELGAAVLADHPARLEVLLEDRPRLGLRVGGGEHAVDRPREVDRRRTCGADHRGALLAAAGVRGEHHAERAADPDRRRARAPRAVGSRRPPPQASPAAAVRSSPGSSVWSTISTASPVHAPLRACAEPTPGSPRRAPGSPARPSGTSRGPRARRSPRGGRRRRSPPARARSRARARCRSASRC